MQSVETQNTEFMWVLTSIDACQISATDSMHNNY